ncbi:hypothetical protein Pan241w_11480 [Gimesia alba]|uniref:Translational regulator CsrA n=1 Tax=Gimesia alba TaxID=2527973 RepID=A0A517RB26_9PLAN|nr:carbon storage regulator [Gimesia alba]QDT41089.1 hypothetical protein Pan241w_11480 [Gimesia alba]
MLVLERKVDQRIRIGNDVELVIIKTSRGAVKIGIAAPDEVKIVRGELVKESEYEHENAA